MTLLTDKPVRLLVCGGRTFTDQRAVDLALDLWAAIFDRSNLILIQGGARGADACAADWAKRNGVTCETYPANWERDGRRAGPIRNQQMLERKPDFVLAFPGGAGTADMVARARRAGVIVQEVSDGV